jgi:hypothetical protein
MQSARHGQQADPAVDAYPSAARWTRGYGWIGNDLELPSDAFVQALDKGGKIWGDSALYPTLDDAPHDLDRVLAAHLREHHSLR